MAFDSKLLIIVSNLFISCNVLFPECWEKKNRPFYSPDFIHSVCERGKKSPSFLFMKYKTSIFPHLFLFLLQARRKPRSVSPAKRSSSQDSFPHPRWKKKYNLWKEERGGCTPGRSFDHLYVMDWGVKKMLKMMAMVSEFMTFDGYWCDFFGKMSLLAPLEIWKQIGQNASSKKVNK